MVSAIGVEKACGERTSELASKWVSERTSKSLLAMNNMETMTLASTRAVRLNKFQIREYYYFYVKDDTRMRKKKYSLLLDFISWWRLDPFYSEHVRSQLYVHIYGNNASVWVGENRYFFFFFTSNMEVFRQIALKRKNERLGMNGQHHTLYYFYSTIFGCYSFTSDLLGYVTFTTGKKKIINRYCTPSHN